MKNLSKLRGVIAVLVITVFFTATLASCDEPEGGTIIVKNTLSEDITVSIEQMEIANNNYDPPGYTYNIIGKPYSGIPIAAHSTKAVDVSNDGVYRVSYYVTSDTEKEIVGEKTAWVEYNSLSAGIITSKFMVIF